MAIWLQTSIWENRLKTTYLVILMFFLSYLVIFLSQYFLNKFEFSQKMLTETLALSWIFTVSLILWLLIVIFFNKNMIFWFTQAKPLTRIQCPEIYNIVENLCISRWLPMVSIWIIDDDSLNAYASWWWKKNSYIVFSKWLLKKLNTQEIEAVAAHELTHIINEDTKLMLISSIYIWFVTTVWYYLMKIWFWAKSSNWKKSWAPYLILLGLALYLIWILILPLINLAISRKREFLADAWSVELTHDKNALMSALIKISQDSTIEAVTNKNLSWMFINDPFQKIRYWANWEKIEKKSFFWDFFSTHPSLENRINALKNY